MTGYEDKYCQWVEVVDPDGEMLHETECNNTHVFMAGNCTDNDYRFCPYCGKEISEILHEEYLEVGTE